MKCNVIILILCYFNSIKVQLELLNFIVLLTFQKDFNSIKVQLEPVNP